MTCPITITVARGAMSRTTAFGSYGNEREEIEAILERAENEQPDDTTILLRAFYLVELMLKRCESEIGVQPTLGPAIFSTPCFPRSYTGLTQMLRWCCRRRRLLVVEYGEAHLGGELVARLTTSRVRESQRRLEQLVKAIRLLRPALRRSFREAMLFATIAEDHLNVIGECPWLPQRLLSISIHNPLSPWNLIQPSPE